MALNSCSARDFLGVLKARCLKPRSSKGHRHILCKGNSLPRIWAQQLLICRKWKDYLASALENCVRRNMMTGPKGLCFAVTAATWYSWKISGDAILNSSSGTFLGPVFNFFPGLCDRRAHQCPTTNNYQTHFSQI